MKKLTNEQMAAIYCVKHGHANYVTMCFGYVSCGRCGTQIGDKLGGVFDTRKKLVVGCKAHPCKTCDPLIKKLNKNDKKVYERLSKYPRRSHEEILKGIEFSEY